MSEHEHAWEPVWNSFLDPPRPIGGLHICHECGAVLKKRQSTPGRNAEPDTESAWDE